MDFILPLLLIDDYAKDGGSEEVWRLCSLYHDSFRAHIIRNVGNFVTWACIGYKSKIDTSWSHLKLSSEF